MRHKTVTILKMEGYEVLEASDGAEGIRLAHDELPDLILCDLMMPERNGYDVLQAVHAFRPTATTPFILSTAKGEKPDVRAGMNLGADDYLVKPVSHVNLLEAVEARASPVSQGETASPRVGQRHQPFPALSDQARRFANCRADVILLQK